MDKTLEDHPAHAYIDGLGDRIDGQEDIDAREKMFDRLEQEEWDRMAASLKGRAHKKGENDG